MNRAASYWSPRNLGLLITALLFIIGTESCRKAPTPKLFALEPQTGPPGFPVTLRGEHLTYFNYLDFCGELIYEQNLIVFTNDEIQFIVPPGLGPFSCDVAIVHDDGLSNIITFQVTEPVVQSNQPILVCPDNPYKVLPGENIEVRVSNFNADDLNVFFGTEESNEIVVLDDSTLQVEVPVITTSGEILIQSNSLLSDPCPYTLRLTPVLTSLEPDSSWSGSRIELRGDHFFQDSTQVIFSDALTLGYEEVSFVSSTLIEVTVPDGVVSGPVQVTTPCGNSNTLPFSIIEPRPQIDTVVPSKGEVGDPVTIRGQNFDNLTKVTFDGTVATVNSSSAEEISVTVPDVNPGDVPVVVQTTAGTSDPVIFQVEDATIPDPVIGVLSSDELRVGDELLIIGNNFTVSGNPTLRFRSTTETASDILVNANDFLELTNTRIRLIVPVGAWTGALIVNNGSSNPASKIVSILPKIEIVDPPTQNIGETVMLSGYNYPSSGLIKVTFGGVLSNAVATRLDDKKLEVTIPDNVGTGTKRVQLELDNGLSNDDQTVEILSATPVIADIEPRTTSVGCPVTITGQFFMDPIRVFYSGLEVPPSQITLISSQELEVITPDLQGNNTVVVEINGQSSNDQLAIVNPKPRIARPQPTRQHQGGPLFLYGDNLDLVDEIYFNTTSEKVNGMPLRAGYFAASDYDALEEDLIVLNVPEIGPQNAADLYLKIKDNTCYSDTIPFEISNVVSDMAPGVGNPYTVVVPFPPAGSSITGISNQWSLIRNWFTDNPQADTKPFTLIDGNTGCFINDNDTCSIEYDDGGPSVETIGAFTNDLDYIDIIIDSKEYEGKRDRLYPTLSNNEYPIRILLVPVNDFGDQYELIFPFIINGLSRNSGSAGEKVRISGRYFFSGTDIPVAYDVNFYDADGSIDVSQPTFKLELSRNEVQYIDGKTLEFEIPSIPSGNYQITIGVAEFIEISNPLSFTVN